MHTTHFAKDFFTAVTNWPKTIVTIGMVALFGMVSFIPSLTRDTTSDAFIPKDNPARVYRETVKDQFGLSDPVIVAVSNLGPHGVFEPETLALVERLTAGMQDLPNIDPERVVSLATENNIVGTKYGMVVEPFFDPVPDNLADSQAIWAAVQDFPLYLGSLVAEDGKGTLIIGEVLDETKSEEVYFAVAELANNAELPPGVELHVAGEAAIAGYLGRYIATDAQRLNPLAALMITLVLFICFRTLRGALTPSIVIAAAIASAMGFMAAAGVPFFVITNAMPVVLIGIAVADAVHVYTQYYHEVSLDAAIDRQTAIVRAMTSICRPITLTTLTTMAGFFGLYLASVMPPMRYLGVFTALGVGVAWLYTLTVLPALMMFFKPKPSRAYQRASGDVFARLMSAIGHVVLRYSRTTIAVAVSAIALGIVGAASIRVDENRIDNFNANEPIVQADRFINDHFDGTSVMDIVVETDVPEGLFDPARLKKIEAFQAYMEQNPSVGGTTSIVDYLKQMNRSVNEGRADMYVTPDDDLLTAQLFLLYSASGDPTDFEEEVDYHYQRANIRTTLKTGWYSKNAALIEDFQRYVDDEFNEPGLKATLSGHAVVSYEWVNGIKASHFKSVGISLVLVLAMAVIVFRSLTAGLYTVIPIVTSITFVYAVMVANDIFIGVGTSMFAAVAIGLGVDFAIHTVDRIKELFADRAIDDVERRLSSLFPLTGRALLFNFLAIALGFGTLMTSDVVPLARFGAIVVLAVASSFFMSLMLIPAMVNVFRPAFVFGERKSPRRLIGSTAAVLLVAILAAPAARADSWAGAETFSGHEVMQRVDQRDDGEFVVRRLKMELTDRRGRTRVRETVSYRRYFGDERRSVVFYTSPSNIKDTAFLTWDYAEAERDDDQWLYLPAVRKVRRISASDRGDYFLGTDFTYEDIKREGKGNLEDFHHERVGEATVNGVPTIVIEGTPVSNAIAKELGYGRAVSYVDPETWMIRKSEFWDVKLNPLKTLTQVRIENIDGIWTATEIHIENHKTGHQTRFYFSDVDYEAEVDAGWFETRRLARGL